MLNFTTNTVLIDEFKQTLRTNPSLIESLLAAPDEATFFRNATVISNQLSQDFSIDDIASYFTSQKAQRRLDFDLTEEQLVAVADSTPHMSRNTGSCGSSHCPTGGSTHGCKW